MKASVLCTNKRMYLESQIFLESNQRFLPVFFSGYEQSKDKDKCLLKDKTGVKQKVLVCLCGRLCLSSQSLVASLAHFFPLKCIGGSDNLFLDEQQLYLIVHYFSISDLKNKNHNQNFFFLQLNC